MLLNISILPNDFVKFYVTSSFFSFMYRAIPVIHPTLEFRHQQENYMRHMTNVTAAKATIDTSHPPPCPRLEVYQRRMTRDRAMRLKIENEYIRAIKAAALERTRARAPRTAHQRTKPPRDWERELPKVNEELTGKPRPPKTAASRRREESIFEQEIYQDDGMVVIDERKAKPVLQRRVKSQRVVKPTTAKGRQVSWRRSVHEMEEERRNEEKKTVALGEDQEDEKSQHSDEEKKTDLSRTFGDDFENDEQSDKKTDLSRTFGDDFENEEQSEKKTDLSRTFGDDFENEEQSEKKMDMSRTFGDDFDEDAQNEKKMDMSRTFGDDFEESDKKSEGEASDKDAPESDNNRSESEKQTDSDRESSHSATESSSESEKSRDSSKASGEYSADSDVNDAKLDTNMMAGALMANADGDEDFRMIIRTDVDKQNADSPDVL